MTRLFLLTAALAATAAGAACAQSLPDRDDPAWEAVGAAPDGTRYFIFPARTSVTYDVRGSAAHTLVQLTLKAVVAPDPDGAPNTVVAEAFVDCASDAIGVGTAAYYNETEGLLRTVERPGVPAPSPATDPGQILMIRHVCKAD